ncbi:MAG: hypothetical protein ACLRHD_07375, partial [Thomasclavelia spiroformis]
EIQMASSLLTPFLALKEGRRFLDFPLSCLVPTRKGCLLHYLLNFLISNDTTKIIGAKPSSIWHFKTIQNGICIYRQIKRERKNALPL